MFDDPELREMHFSNVHLQNPCHELEERVDYTTGKIIPRPWWKRIVDPI